MFSYCNYISVFLFNVCVLGNNALRAHHASAHGGVSTYGLSDSWLIFFNDSIELLEIMFDGRAFHYLAIVGEKTVSECVGRVLNVTWAADVSNWETFQVCYGICHLRVCIACGQSATGFFC